MENLFQLGLAIRERRKSQSLTLKDVAALTSLSSGLLSKIENSRTVPSLPVLMRIAEALHYPLSDLMRSIESEQGNNYILVCNEDRESVQRENTDNYQYETILATSVQSAIFETALMTLTDNACGELIQTDGGMFVFAVAGDLYIQLADERIDLAQGDSIYFDGRTPHLARRDGAKGCSVILVVYLLQEGSASRG
ncbi:MAG: helix-turn-helix transcriptional regulator [Planctomycetes bacterium]|nr:helix-turn-helix transcriptional regulator [Planctomycetota bacterium]